MCGHYGGMSVGRLAAQWPPPMVALLLSPAATELPETILGPLMAARWWR